MARPGRARPLRGSRAGQHQTCSTLLWCEL
ncbi:hypothetical protein ABZV60_34985 [Streptomyces sp. NPDC004787]